jgi:hypothetical protein
MMEHAAQIAPVRYCSNEQVQRFCEVEALDLDPHTGKSGRQVFAEARSRFGDMACWDLIIWWH